jgi:RNA polymerase sigma-70 factor, ECF subfamily
VQGELVRRAKAGDQAAFETLVPPEFERLYGLAGLLLSDRSRAEDAVQEALLRAWRDLCRACATPTSSSPGCGGWW